MVSISLPTNFSYSSSYHGNIKNKTKVSREEFLECIKKGMVYSEVNEIYPISVSTYNRMLDKYGLQRDTFRMQQRRDKQMMDMLNSGATIEEIAKARNISVHSCRQLFSNMGVTFGKESLVIRNKEAVTELVNAGLNLTQIAKKLGVSPEKVRTICESINLMPASMEKLEFTQSLKKSNVQSWIDTYKSIPNIAKNVKLSENTVRKYIKFFGLHI